MACIPVYKGKKFSSTKKLIEFLSTEEGIMAHLADGKDAEFTKAVEDAVGIADKTLGEKAPKAEAPKPKAEAPKPKAEAPKPKAEAPKPKAEKTSPLTPFQTKDKEGQAARAALKESVGPKEFKRLENFAKNGEKILRDLESRNVLKIDCP